MQALHYADILRTGNSERRLATEVRQSLWVAGYAERELLNATHAQLLELGRSGNRELAGGTIPRYLFAMAGQAYHMASLGQTEQALTLYSQAVEGFLTGEQWLAANLAEEHEAQGILREKSTAGTVSSGNGVLSRE
jgi:hypothetical protein